MQYSSAPFICCPDYSPFGKCMSLLVISIRAVGTRGDVDWESPYCEPLMIKGHRYWCLQTQNHHKRPDLLPPRQYSERLKKKVWNWPANPSCLMHSCVCSWLRVCWHGSIRLCPPPCLPSVGIQLWSVFGGSDSRFSVLRRPVWTFSLNSSFLHIADALRSEINYILQGSAQIPVQVFHKCMMTW